MTSPLVEKIAVVLPFVLPVLGGGIGIFYVTLFAREANPFIWVVIGVVLGRLLAVGLVKLFGARDGNDVFSPRRQDKVD